MSSGLGVVQYELDHEHGLITLVLTDGRQLSLPASESYDPRMGIRRTAYDVASSTMTLDLVEGRSVVVEVGNGDDNASRAGRPVVYLDQCHWVSLARCLHSPGKLNDTERRAAATVIDWARRGLIILPVSGAHMSEIGSARPGYRATLIPLMLELCRGWQMRCPLHVRRRELLTVFTARRDGRAPTGSVRPHGVFTLEPGALFDTYEPVISSLPREVAELHRRLTWVSAMYSAILDEDPVDLSLGEGMAGRWAGSFQDLSQELRDNPVARQHSREVVLARLLVDMQDDVVQVAAVSGMTSEQFHTWLVEQAQNDVSRLPYVGTVYEATHVRLRNAGDAWTGHDLTDMLYLACASAYADFVVCEKKAADYISRAWRGRTGDVPLLTKLSALVGQVQARFAHLTA